MSGAAKTLRAGEARAGDIALTLKETQSLNSQKLEGKAVGMYEPTHTGLEGLGGQQGEEAAQMAERN